MKKIIPYTQNDFTPVPTKFSVFMRTCIPWQFIRFVIVNIKMLIVVSKSH